MHKVTIYFDTIAGPHIEYVEGEIEIGSPRKVKEITGSAQRVSIEFENGEGKDFVGFRYIMEKINEKPI